MSKPISKPSILDFLGPGILFASTAIGVSHLVQSTRAGAEYGFALVLFILLANVFKYPFFEFGSRYASATGESILTGYTRLGSWALPMYLVVTLITMFTVAGTVTFVTAGLLVNIFQLPISPTIVTGLLFLLSTLILSIGRFGALSQVLKVIGLLLLISTVTATVLVLVNADHAPAIHWFPQNWERGDVFFVIALMGWMPTAIDLSAWNSLWTIEKRKQLGFAPSLKNTLNEFAFGYGISAFLAFCFVILGAYLLFGTEEVLSDNAVQFSGQLIQLYIKSIGQWCYPIIALAAICTMFSTSITVLDGYSRATVETVRLLWNVSPSTKITVGVMLGLSSVSFLLVYQFAHSLKTLVDLATTLSFLVAPVIAYFNYQLVSGKYIEKAFQPGPIIRWLARVGLIFLILFSVLYLVTFFK